MPTIKSNRVMHEPKDRKFFLFLLKFVKQYELISTSLTALI